MAKKNMAKKKMSAKIIKETKQIKSFMEFLGVVHAAMQSDRYVAFWDIEVVDFFDVLRRTIKKLPWDEGVIVRFWDWLSSEYQSNCKHVALGDFDIDEEITNYFNGDPQD